jgi:hypothetical protein
LLKLYYKSKNWLDYLLDRVIDVADMFLMDAYQPPRLIGRKRGHRVARTVGDLCWLVRSFPRLPVYKLSGSRWTLIFIGEERDLPEICHSLFLEEEPVPEKIARIPLWKISQWVQQQLNQNTADLIICELSCLYPKQLKAPITFVVPSWINQEVHIPDPPDQLIAGKRYSTERNRLNKAKRLGFDYQFSQSQADFDYFHHEMYVPYSQTRHRDLAIVGQYQDQQKRWFSRGGVVLISQENKPVAGVMCYLTNGICFDVSRGVLHADQELFRLGIDTIITWSVINWAHQQGAKVYNIGGARPRCTDGAFSSKRHWSAQVTRRKKIYPQWLFLAKDLSPVLREYLNRLEFITEIENNFYQVLLLNPGESLTQAEIDEKVGVAQQQGLAGIALVSSNTHTKVYV